MILNVLPIIQRIRDTDFASASIPTSRAIYGILNVLGDWVDGGDDLIRLLMKSQPGAFLHEKQSIDGYEQSDIVWNTIPLKERLLRLKAFYQTDIHLLSEGDDRKARQLLTTAERTFELCREEAFDTCDSCIEEFLLYFHVLCLARPGYRHPDNVRLYLDYNRIFDVLPISQYDEDSDVAWQYREVRWSGYMLHEQHFDLSLLPLLSFADDEACLQFRLQCYKWMLDLDPEDDHSVQTQALKSAFVDKGVGNLIKWLQSKYANHTMLEPEVEATALLTIYCGMNTSPYGQQLVADIEENAYNLTDQLPASKLRTRLMAHIAMYDENPELTESSIADIAAWDKSQLTQEDLYLTALHHSLPSA